MTDTHRPVTIYISAASDLMFEREALARLIAKLPVTLAWQIFQTPLGDEAFDPAPLATTDIHVLLLGGDIRAPVGAELYAARQTGLPTVAFLKRGVARTTAGQIFSKEARLPWRHFVSVADLSRQVQQLLVDHLISRAVQYALTPVEVEQLEALKTAEQPTAGDNRQTSEAGHSAVILSRERYSPREGVIIGEET